MSLYLHYNKDVKAPGFGLRCLTFLTLKISVFPDSGLIPGRKGQFTSIESKVNGHAPEYVENLRTSLDKRRCES